MCLGFVPPSTRTRSETRTDVGSEGAAKAAQASGGRGGWEVGAARSSGQRWRSGEKGAETGEADTCSQMLHLDDVKFRWRKSSTCEVIRQDQIIQGNGFVEKRGTQ